MANTYEATNALRTGASKVRDFLHHHGLPVDGFVNATHRRVFVRDGILPCAKHALGSAWAATVGQVILPPAPVERVEGVLTRVFALHVPKNHRVSSRVMVGKLAQEFSGLATGMGHSVAECFVEQLGQAAKRMPNGRLNLKVSGRHVVVLASDEGIHIGGL